MSGLRTQLLAELRKIAGVEPRPSAVAGGLALYYKGKSFAHFHHDHELDLRLTRSVIKAQGLSHPKDSVCHPHRSPQSAWIEIRFHSAHDIQRISQLVALAVTKL